MSKSLNPYDFGNNFQLVENCQKISIDDMVRLATKSLKKRIIEAQIDVLGINVKITTSKCGFSGERLYFLCPTCNKKVRTLYQAVYSKIACRKCLGLSYKKQRYKGMVELTTM